MIRVSWNIHAKTISVNNTHFHTSEKQNRNTSRHVPSNEEKASIAIDFWCLRTQLSEERNVNIDNIVAGTVLYIVGR